MERNLFKNILYKGDDGLMTQLVEQKLEGLSKNEILVFQVLQELIRCGVKEICVCPSTRNAPFVTALHKTGLFKQYFWPEERSAAFFALGRCKVTNLPVPVLTTSGTATGELLPAAMEAYYTQIPLILLTTDRPRRFRGTCAPQTAEQVGLYGQYAVFEQDIAEDELCSLLHWKQNGPAHINVCLEEPLSQNFEHIPIFIKDYFYCVESKDSLDAATNNLDHFLKKSRFPLVVVSTIKPECRESIIKFLKNYRAPVYLESLCGLREDSRLNHLRIIKSDHIWKAAEAAGYPIDGILRIGSVPTVRLWRDLEDRCGKVHVCSISDLPFSGLSWGEINCVPLKKFFTHYQSPCAVNETPAKWIASDRTFFNKALELITKDPCSESALMYQLSKRIPSESFVYLGNSLPIREWNSFGDTSTAHANVFANRGLNGIDGQISTFLGMCEKDRPNWCIIGDLTTIYDLAAPWILDQMKEIDLNLIVINNGGGKIFVRMFPLEQMQNRHHIGFKSLADLWNMHYEYYTQLPEKLPYGGHRLIEIVPDEQSTIRFWSNIVNI